MVTKFQHYTANLHLNLGGARADDPIHWERIVRAAIADRPSIRVSTGHARGNGWCEPFDASEKLSPQDLAPGSLVVLASGGPLMTIAGPNGVVQLNCVWWNEELRRFDQAAFSPGTLRRASRADTRGLS
jgi:uncharacterized protein YodC (DUF2158 family)